MMIRRISDQELGAIILDLNFPLAISLADWRYLSEWDCELFGGLSDSFIEELEVPCDGDVAGPLGFFWVDSEHIDMTRVRRLFSSESSKVLVCDPSSAFFSSIGEFLLRDLSIPGEFSRDAMNDLNRLVGFKWLILNDGSEFDDPYFLFQPKFDT